MRTGKRIKPTEKQTAYVNRIIDCLGQQSVHEYIQYFYPTVTMKNLTKDQAQKIITGLSHHLPRKHWGGNGMSMGWIQSQ
ncbi:hypothetical protein D3C74_441230 [compost metagenome]